MCKNNVIKITWYYTKSKDKPLRKLQINVVAEVIFPHFRIRPFLCNGRGPGFEPQSRNFIVLINCYEFISHLYI